MRNATIVKDPVCGMEVEITTTTARTQHAGQTYYFCAAGCKDQFDRNPEQYLAAKSGGGCCS